MPKFSISKGTAEQLHQGEYAAWEDAGCPSEVPEDGDPSSAYMVPILERWKTRLELQNEMEARSALRSLRYHQAARGLYWWTPAFGRACARLVAQIEETFDLE